MAQYKYSRDDYYRLTNAPCIDVALALGMEINERASDQKAWKMKDEQGLCIYREGNNWYRFSDGRHGFSIDLVIDKLGCSREQALDFIAKNVVNGVSEQVRLDHKAPAKVKKELPKEKIFTVPDHDVKPSRVMAYLIKTRGIDPEIVKGMLQRKMIAEDSAHHNCLFFGRDEKGNIRSCAQRGISGGLDSTLALLVCVEAMKLLGRPASDILAVTMPCFGTTKRTRSNAERLCELLGTRLRVIDIADSVKQHFKDIGHDESNHNVVYENGQARERTKILMDLANAENGMVIGTGDLSELALGWATYNGDHMSMYGVNASVPKTLVRYIVKYYAGTVGGADLREVLMSIYDTPVSPELLPADENGDIAQITEDLVGPYELHDFFLYNGIRWCFPPSKVFRLAEYAFDGSYDRETILKWLRTFYRRFFSQQFKRSCLPDGVKVGSVTLSPRGDWRMPSDASAALWLEEVNRL